MHEVNPYENISTTSDIRENIKNIIVEEFFLGTEFLVQHSIVDFRMVNFKRKLDQYLTKSTQTFQKISEKDIAEFIIKLVWDNPSIIETSAIVRKMIDH